jgi:hypothetical protein
MKFRTLAAVITAVVLAGCTSTGIAYNPPNGGNIVTLDIYGSATIVYQTSLHGAWKVLPAGQTQFETTDGTAYGVAYYCASQPGIVTAAAQGVRPQRITYGTFVLQATTSEIDVVPVYCANPTEGTLSGSYDASAFATTANVEVDGYNVGSTATGDYSTLLPLGTQDVFATAFDGSGNLLALKTYPNVAVTSSTTLDITVGAADAVGSPQTLTLTNIPASSYSSYVEMDYGEIGGELAFMASGSTSTPYSTVAAADTDANDAYFAYGDAYVSDGATAIYVEHDLYQQSAPASVVLPAAFDPANPATTGNPQFTLDYTGYAALHGGISGYVINESWYGTDSGNVVGVVTSGYLKLTGKKTYTVPVVTIAGFPSMTAQSGDGYSWETDAFYGYAPLLVTRFVSATSVGHRKGQSQPASRQVLAHALTAMRAQSTGSLATSGDAYFADGGNCYTVGGSTTGC